ncbi:MAG: hypothetical protein WBI82_02890 [Sphaerochaeta sp.]
MKRYLLIVYILLLTCTLGAGPASVSITLTTSVPGYLYHGFLDSAGETAFVVDSPTVNDAFNPAGAVLNYAIKTNTGLPLTVDAKIYDFTQLDVPQPATISISQVEVVSPTDPTAILPHSNTNTYNLLTLTPTSGTIFYPYTLTVYANQTQVQNSPIGNYQSTVEISIGLD